MSACGFVAGVAYTMTTPFAQSIHGLSRWTFYLPFSAGGIGAQMTLTGAPMFLAFAMLARALGRRGWIWHLLVGAASGLATGAGLMALSGADVADILRAMPGGAVFNAAAGCLLGGVTVLLDKLIARARDGGV